MNTLLLIYCIVLSFSGFVIAFYGILAESQIDKITEDGIKKGINLNTEEGAKFYARKYEKWRAGSYFVSKSAVTYGVIISVIAGIICAFNNPWWSFIVVIIAGYIAYLLIAKIIGWHIQIFSLLTLIISIILIIINII